MAGIGSAPSTALSALACEARCASVRADSCMLTAALAAAPPPSPSSSSPSLSFSRSSASTSALRGGGEVGLIRMAHSEKPSGTGENRLQREPLGCPACPAPPAKRTWPAPAPRGGAGRGRWQTGGSAPAPPRAACCGGGCRGCAVGLGELDEESGQAPHCRPRLPTCCLPPAPVPATDCSHIEVQRGQRYERALPAQQPPGGGQDDAQAADRQARLQVGGVDELRACGWVGRAQARGLSGCTGLLHPPATWRRTLVPCPRMLQAAAAAAPAAPVHALMISGVLAIRYLKSGNWVML